LSREFFHFAHGSAPPTRRSSGASGDNAAGVPLNSTLAVTIRTTVDFLNR
jgi:hypothetical protein